MIGMSHRGRLNVLANVMQKSMTKIFCEFADKETSVDGVQGSGDVKYHLGTSNDRVLGNGRAIHLSLAANPSHLEAVDPIAIGKTRAKQFYNGDTTRRRTMAILLHGDAAFAGQGVVAETVGMSQLPDYSTGGTVHIVVNNQIGFTTVPKFSRSSPYPTDVAKGLQCPIFHVNGDDPEAVVRVCEIAMDWRQQFQKDVVVDIFCYRRHGHNEMDQPMFTQPIMYTKIKDHAPTLDIYAKQLLSEGVLKPEDVTQVREQYKQACEAQFERSKSHVQSPSDWLEANWSGMLRPSIRAKERPTGVAVDLLREIGLKVTKLPEDYTVHKNIAKLYQAREEAIKSGKNIEWGTAEALAFATLLSEGYAVRLSGQDSERGTFSHRHAIVYDQSTERTYSPLNNIGPHQALLQVSNSSLSEFGVMGFELGYSLENPRTFVIWEAQFGDFANGAQIIIDQYLSSGEQKWRRQSGLTLFLPHGYEGQGPEHSSARLERFLQLVSEAPDLVNFFFPVFYGYSHIM